MVFIFSVLTLGSDTLGIYFCVCSEVRLSSFIFLMLVSCYSVEKKAHLLLLTVLARVWKGV